MQHEVGNTRHNKRYNYQLPTACSAEKQSPLDPSLCVSLRGAYEMKYLTHVVYFVLLKDQLNPSIRLSRPFTSINTYPKPVLKSSFELVNCYGKGKLRAPGPLAVRSLSRRRLKGNRSKSGRSANCLWKTNNVGCQVHSLFCFVQ